MQFILNIILNLLSIEKCELQKIETKKAQPKLSFIISKKE